MTTPPAPPPLGQAPRGGWGSGRPTGLANAAIGLAGGTALLTLLAAFPTRTVYDHFDRYTGSDPTFDGTYLASQGLQSLASILMLGTYIVLALWMSKIHERLTEAGETLPLARPWAWFVWLIPVANVVMPYLYIRALNRRARTWAVGPWWGAWLASGLVSLVGVAQMIGASDFSSVFDDPNDPLAGLDFAPLGAAGIASALVLVAAWALLAVMVRDITRRDLG